MRENVNGVNFTKMNDFVLLHEFGFLDKKTFKIMNEKKLKLLLASHTDTYFTSS